MMTPASFIFAFLLGIASTLPLGPSGMSIISAFALNGSKSGRHALYGLLGAELCYMSLAFLLRSLGILSLSHTFEVILTLVFSIFLVVFGVMTFKNRKAENMVSAVSFKKVFLMSVMNPTILIFYLGLMIMAEKKSTGELTTTGLLMLGVFFLSGVVTTLMSLGNLALSKSDFIKHHLVRIKFILGPLFIILGISSAMASF